MRRKQEQKPAEVGKALCDASTREHRPQKGDAASNVRPEFAQ
jgi:hypothetical protein